MAALRAPTLPVYRRSLPEALRMAFVWGCALALAGAGPFLPGIAW